MPQASRWDIQDIIITNRHEEQTVTLTATPSGDGLPVACFRFLGI